MAVLERDVEVGQDAALGHQRDQLADVRVGVDVVEPHPGAEGAELAGEVGDVAADRAAAPVVGVVAAVGAVGGGVLADDEELAHAGRDQPLGLAQDGVRRPRDELAAHVGDDAEAALVVTTLGNLEVAVVPRRELNRARRQEVDVGVGRRRHGGVHRVDHRLVLLRAGDGEHGRMRAADVALVGAEAAGDDDPAVLAQRLADRLEALGLGAVEKAAGVDDHRVRRRRSRARSRSLRRGAGSGSARCRPAPWGSRG